MKLKLDENLSPRLAIPLRTAGHDVSTVREQAMIGASHSDLIERCRRERRAIVTLDLGFANPLIYRPSRYHGIAILRVPRNPSTRALHDLISTLGSALDKERLDGKL
ncbi:MAG: DUF5615 family PIN-like protein [Candidatus Binataceae bacterium]